VTLRWQQPVAARPCIPLALATAECCQTAAAEEPHLWQTVDIAAPDGAKPDARPTPLYPHKFGTPASEAGVPRG
jgi:hypothetical protein